MEEMSLKYPKRVTLWPTTRRTGLKMYLLPLMPSLQWPSPVYSGWWPSLRLLASVEAPGCLQLSAVIYLSQQADVKNTLVLEMSQMGEKRNRSRVFVWLIGPISDSQKDTFFFFFLVAQTYPQTSTLRPEGSSSLLCGADGLERGKEQFIFVNILYLVTAGGGTKRGCGRVVALVLAEAV